MWEKSSCIVTCAFNLMGAFPSHSCRGVPDVVGIVPAGSTSVILVLLGLRRARIFLSVVLPPSAVKGRLGWDRRLGCRWGTRCWALQVYSSCFPACCPIEGLCCGAACTDDVIHHVPLGWERSATRLCRYAPRQSGRSRRLGIFVVCHLAPICRLLLLAGSRGIP